MNSTPIRAARRAPRVSRRNFIRSSAAVAGSQTLLLSTSQAASTSLEGYASATSVAVGGTLSLHARDPQALGTGTTVYPLTIVRIGYPDVTMLSTTVTLGNQAVPADVVANGCRWPASYRFSVPNSWPSGIYFAAIGSGPNACTVPFIVRAVSATAGTKVLVQVPVTTVHAYNAYGGKSLYDFNSSDGVRSPKVSFDRPLTDAFNTSFDNWSQYLARWLAKNRIAADFCTSHDLHANANLLDPYQLYLSAGHDEYWTRDMRDHLDAFVAVGGNAAIFGGNTCWWQARLEGSGNRTLVCYKSLSADPVADLRLKTVNWRDLAQPFPENATVGLGFIKGASWTNGFARPVTPYVVQRPEHWVFAGTGLAKGAGFGGEFVGYETDAADFRSAGDGLFHPTGLDGTPATLRILAQADASDWDAKAQALGLSGELSGYATLGVFSRGGKQGTVFNAGSVDWAYGLGAELNGQTPSPISRITLNVVTQLTRAWGESADVRQFHSTSGTDPWNCTYATSTQSTVSGASLDGVAFRGFVSAESGTIPIYRYRSARAGTGGYRYRYSWTSTLDLFGLNWVLEGVAFHAYGLAASDRIAVYKYSASNASGQDFYRLSTSATAPAGWNSMGVLFYAPKA
jgi:hypothetical protein